MEDTETQQRRETLAYFRTHADDWEKEACMDAADRVNVIKQRNDYVLSVVDARETTEVALDLGCGTGDLVFEIASRGIDAIGVDFSREMIDIADDQAKTVEQGSTAFHCCSVSDFRFEPYTYDVISANGLVEYLPRGALDRLLNHCLKSLKTGGSLILGSRNRLFNLFSLNEFTKDEIAGGDLAMLLREAVRVAKARTLAELTGWPAAPLQRERQEHKNTGIDVATRYQFTPTQLVNILHDKGFEPFEIAPIHIHGVTPAFKDENPETHARIANDLQRSAGNRMSLIPQSSSFMIHAKKCAT